MANRKQNIIAGAMIIAVLGIVLLLAVQSNLRTASARGAPGRSFEIEWTVDVAGLGGSAEDFRIYVPLPLESDAQELHNFRIENDWSYEVLDESVHGNRFILITPDYEQFIEAQQPIKVTFYVTRYRVSPIDEKQRKPAFMRPDVDRYLRSTELMPTSGLIAENAQSIAGIGTEPLTKARLLYNHVVDTVEYEVGGQGAGSGNAMYAFAGKKGNCLDMHSLFVAQARSLGIPARTIMGLEIPAGSAEGQIESYHCWAEFYIQSKGWLPVDVSQASQNPGQRVELFGRLDHNRVAFTVGRDIELPESESEPQNFVIRPYVELNSQEYGDVRTSYSFAQVTRDYIETITDGD